MNGFAMARKSGALPSSQDAGVQSSASEKEATPVDETVPNLLHTTQLETIVGILRKRAQQAKVTLPKEMAFFIAQNIRSNARALERMLNRFAALNRVVHPWANSTELTRNFTQQVLQHSVDKQVCEAVDRLQESPSSQFGTKAANIGRQESTAANQDFAFSLLFARLGKEATRVRQKSEVNMRESERERLARHDAHERELEIRAKERKQA